MFRFLLNHLPFWEIIFLSLVFFMTLSYFSARLSVFLFAKPVDKEHRALANTLIGILSSGFSVLLAFSIITTWTYVVQTGEIVSKEAAYLKMLLHALEGFPANKAAPMQKAIGDYTVAVRVHEWSTMRVGKESSKAAQALTNLFRVVKHIQPESSQQNLFYGQIVAGLENLLREREERLSKIESIIPIQLRGALIVGTIFLVIILGSVRGESRLGEIAPALLFSLLLGFNLALVLAFDYPFSGEVTVSNEPFYKDALADFKD